MGYVRRACALGLVLAGGCAVSTGHDGAHIPIVELDPRMCVGVKGTGLDVKSCDTMNITPASAGGPAALLCDPTGGTAGNAPPPGYAACQRGFTIFNQGPAEDLQRCLSAIGVEPPAACDPRRVQRCMSEMYNATCAVDLVTKHCNDVATACKDSGQAFDAAKCAYELKPFNAQTFSAYEACFNTADPSLTCQQAHDNCFIAQL